MTNTTQHTLSFDIGSFRIALDNVATATVGGRAVVPGSTLTSLQAVAARAALENQADDSAALRYARKLMGLPAKAFASELGVTPETVSRWENAKSTPSMTARKLVIAMLERVERGQPAIASPPVRCIEEPDSGDVLHGDGPVRNFRCTAPTRQSA